MFKKLSILVLTSFVTILPLSAQQSTFGTPTGATGNANSVANALAQCLWALQKKSIGFCLTGILGNYAEGASLSLCLPCPTSFAGHGGIENN